MLMRQLGHLQISQKSPCNMDLGHPNLPPQLYHLNDKIFQMDIIYQDNYITLMLSNNCIYNSECNLFKLFLINCRI